MRGYSMDWEAVMRLPIRVFWSLLKNLNKLRAAEDIRWMNRLWMQNASEQGRKEFIESCKAQIGTVVLETPVRDVVGIEKLKAMAMSS